MTQKTHHEEPWLQELLAEDPIIDDGFSSVVMKRIEQKRKLSGFLFYLGMAACVLMVFLSLPAVLPDLSSTLFHVEGIHLLGGFMALGFGLIFWVDSENDVLPNLP